jgi:NAD(P)-dependent dehydrogenase (short-subunit alcohol dehydrogenase family)
MSELFSVSGKVALVTGASSGIGARFATVLAKHGAAVACCARRKGRLDALVDEIHDAGGRALAVELDVTRPESIEPVFDRIEQALGTVGILVNAAGAVGTLMPVHQSSLEAWQQGLATNLTPFYTMSAEAARRLIAAGRPGSIINVSSIGGLRGTGTGANYSTPKAGCIHLSKSLALELAPHGIRCNVLCPGLVETELMPAGFLESEPGRRIIDHIPLGGPAQPEDLDGVLLLLASDASRFMTGTEIVVDGGQILGTPGYD